MKSHIHINLTSGLILTWAVIGIMGCTFARLATAVPETALPPTETDQTDTRVTATKTREVEPTLTPDGQAATPPRGAKKGNMAPDFTLSDLQGKEIRLDDLRGSVILLNFWAVWCGYCRIEMPDLQAAFVEFADQDFFILGIDVQENEDVVESYVDQLGITFPILLDKQGQAAIAYQIRGLPTSILIDRQGIIQQVHLGLLTEKNIQDYLARMEIE